MTGVTRYTKDLLSRCPRQHFGLVSQVSKVTFGDMTNLVARLEGKWSLTFSSSCAFDTRGSGIRFRVQQAFTVFDLLDKPVESGKDSFLSRGRVDVFIVVLRYLCRRTRRSLFETAWLKAIAEVEPVFPPLAACPISTGC